MKKLDQTGEGPWLVLFVAFLLLFIFSAVFGAWAFQSRQNYKNNTEAIVAQAVAQAKQKESAAKDKQFAELEKQPLTTYKGPEAYGSVVIKYPKTWSGYVDDTGNGQSVVDGYFAPGVVPSLTDQNSVFALRVQVIAQSYDQVLNSFQGQQQNGLTITPYTAPKVPNVIGVRLDGAIEQDKTGSMVILPVRDKTLELSTEASQFMSDFNNNILPNFTFSP